MIDTQRSQIIILLNELDWELEKRGHVFVRYADDCQIYVRSQRAGERVKQSISHFLEQTLRLKVNVKKSAVARPWERKFLGFTFSPRRGHKIKVSEPALEKLKQTVRKLCRRTRGHSIDRIIAELKKTLLGWKAYFGIAEIKSPQRDVEKWIRDVICGNSGEGRDTESSGDLESNASWPGI